MLKKLKNLIPDPIKTDPVSDTNLAIVLFVALLFILAVSLAPGGGW